MFKTTVIGVDFGSGCLSLIRMEDPSIIVDSKVIPVRIGVDDPEFVQFLKSQINSFCSAVKNKKIWFVMSAANVDVYFMKIPKVPASQIDQVVYAMAKREVSFNDKDIVFDYEINGEVVDGDKTKLSVMFYTAPGKEINRVDSLFKSAGCPLYGITIAPFAIRNFLKSGFFKAAGRNVANIFVGNEYTRIDIYREAAIVFTRDIKIGVSSIVEPLSDHIAEGAETPSLEQVRHMLSNIDSDAVESFNGVDMEKMREVAEPAVERLAMQIERTFEHFAAAPDAVYLSCVLHIEKYLISELTRHIALRCEIFDPLAEVMAGNDFRQRNDLLLAAAVALSNDTPNMLYVRKDKNLEAKRRYVEKVAFIVFVSIMLGLLAFNIKQRADIKSKTFMLYGQERRLPTMLPAHGGMSAVEILERAIKERKAYSDYIKRYLSVGLVNEITTLVPPDIYLTHCKIDIADAAGASGKSGEGRIVIDGVFTGGVESFDSVMADFAAKISNSPMFSTASVKKTVSSPFHKFQLEAGVSKRPK